MKEIGEQRTYEYEKDERGERGEVRGKRTKKGAVWEFRCEGVEDRVRSGGVQGMEERRDASSSERRKVEKVWHSHKDHREHDQ